MTKTVLLFAMCALAVSFSLLASGPAEAPTGFDGRTNGSVVQAEMDAALVQFAGTVKSANYGPVILTVKETLSGQRLP